MLPNFSGRCGGAEPANKKQPQKSDSRHSKQSGAAVPMGQVAPQGAAAAVIPEASSSLEQKGQGS
eukprot:7092987-Prorocentrum_lima.AAC.1